MVTNSPFDPSVSSYISYYILFRDENEVVRVNLFLKNDLKFTYFPFLANFATLSLINGHFTYTSNNYLV